MCLVSRRKSVKMSGLLAWTVIKVNYTAAVDICVCLLCCCVQLQNVGMNRANYHYLLSGLVRPASVRLSL